MNHPLSKVIYFAALLSVTMFTDHPILRAICLLGGAVTVLWIPGGKKGRRLLSGGLAVIPLAALLNFLVSHNGVTVLFRAFRNPMTLESLLFGFSSGAMFAAVLIWCGVLAETVQTTDLVRLSGKAFPSVTTVITVSLRYVPLLLRQFESTRKAHLALGGFPEKGALKKGIFTAKLFLAVTEQSLEQAMETAQTMEARGLGLPGRTLLRRNRFRTADGLTVGLSLAGAALIFCGVGLGWAGWYYYPKFIWLHGGVREYCVYGAAAILAALPMAFYLAEEIRWKNCGSNS